MGRVMKRKYREELDRVISKGEFLNEDQVLKFLNKYKGNIRKTEAKLRKHASYIIKKKEQELAAKTDRREKKFLENERRDQEQHDAKTKALQITRKAQVEELENKKNAVYTRERQVLTDREESKKQKNLAKASYSLAKQKESQAQNFLEDSCALFAEKEAEKEEQSRVHDEHLQQLQEQKQQVQEQKQSVQQKLVERQIDLVKSGSIVWKCDIGNNDLREYDTNIAILLERSYENKNTVEFTRGSHDYFIDWKRFSQGAQVNKSTNVPRKLTRHLFTAADVKIAVSSAETKLKKERKQRTAKRKHEQKLLDAKILKARK